MKHILEYDEFLNESKSYMNSKELIKFLNKLSKDLVVNAPVQIRGGELFDKMGTTKTDVSDLIKALKKYDKKKVNGELSAKISNVIPIEYDSNFLKSLETKPFLNDPGKILKSADKLKSITLSFDYSDFDKDLFRKNVRSMSLD